MYARALATMLLVGGALFAPQVAAQTCAGFTDVLNTDPFCTNVAWMKNRGVTLGCTATTYCGANPVTRLQMAAFMLRVANVVVPSVVDVEAAGGGFDPATRTVLCQTADLPPVTYDRIATLYADLSLSLTGQQSLAVQIVSSADAGANWLVLHNQSPVLWGDASSRQHVTLITNTLPHPLAQANIALGESRRFGVSVVRAGSLTPTITDWTCHLQAAVRTRAE